MERRLAMCSSHNVSMALTCTIDMLIAILSFLMYVSLCTFTICVTDDSTLLMLKTLLLQINLKGLDGLQGPVYVGTGCCFNRQALYGYDPVLTEEDLQPNIIVKSCCGGRKKGRTANKNYIDKKRAAKRTESTIPIFNMEDVEEGVEGNLYASFITSFELRSLDI